MALERPLSDISISYPNVNSSNIGYISALLIKKLSEIMSFFQHGVYLGACEKRANI